MTSDHSRMQRLIAIGLGQTDVVLEAPGNGAEGVVNNRQSPITSLNTGGEDPQGRHVVDLVEGFLLPLHLGPDAEEVLGPAAHLTVLQPDSCQSITEQLNGDS